MFNSLSIICAFIYTIVDSFIQESTFGIMPAVGFEHLTFFVYLKFELAHHFYLISNCIC